MPDFLDDLMCEVRRRQSRVRPVNRTKHRWTMGRLVLLYNARGEPLGLFREWTSRRPLGRRFTRLEDEAGEDGAVKE